MKTIQLKVPQKFTLMLTTISALSNSIYALPSVVYLIFINYFYADDIIIKVMIILCRGMSEMNIISYSLKHNFYLFNDFCCCYRLLFLTMKFCLQELHTQKGMFAALLYEFFIRPNR